MVLQLICNAQNEMPVKTWACAGSLHKYQYDLYNFCWIINTTLHLFEKGAHDANGDIK